MPLPHALTVTRLREVLNYDPQTGVFTRRSSCGGEPAGSVAGSPNQYGHIRVHVDGRRYQAHRLAWLYMSGEWPSTRLEVDHINGNRGDNRWANLRLADKSMNMQNQRHARRDSQSGLLGVETKRWDTGVAYVARIAHRGKRHHLGTHSTPELAHAAYLDAKRAMHEGNTL